MNGAAASPMPASQQQAQHSNASITSTTSGYHCTKGGHMLQDALDVAVRMSLAIPLADIMAYRKVGCPTLACQQQPASCNQHPAAG